uniref:Predicted protein n=1 Tax=Hordeum vulgare subsp. vulgare TaxID=112509 RepID=F2EBW7_HORVV|nr:predicted protein [Hordeum vulgare subsp. vulgare]
MRPLLAPACCLGQATGRAPARALLPPERPTAACRRLPHSAAGPLAAAVCVHSCVASPQPGCVCVCHSQPRVSALLAERSHCCLPLCLAS